MCTCWHDNGLKTAARNFGEYHYVRLDDKMVMNGEKVRIWNIRGWLHVLRRYPDTRLEAEETHNKSLGRGMPSLLKLESVSK